MANGVAPQGYSYVVMTHDEVADYRAKHNGHTPPVYRLACKRCGKRIWGSGLGVGAHERWHNREGTT